MAAPKAHQPQLAEPETPYLRVSHGAYDQDDGDDDGGDGGGRGVSCGEAAAPATTAAGALVGFPGTLPTAPTLDFACEAEGEEPQSPDM